MSMLPDGTTRLSRGGELVYRGLGLAAMAEHVVVAESGRHPIDADLPLDLACIIGCAVQTGVGAVLNTAKVEAGATVLVMGAGRHRPVDRAGRPHRRSHADHRLRPRRVAARDGHGARAPPT